MAKQVFKSSNRAQTMLPLSFDVLIDKNHIVRLIDEIIEQIDISSLLKQYKGGGASAYHPRDLLKILVFAYTQKIFHGRQIAKALHENIYFIWIAGGLKPDFRTINRFRSQALAGAIDGIFTSVITMLVENGYINFKNYFLDGTKIESVANKHTFVWKKSTENYDQKLQVKIKELLAQIHKEIEKENEIYGDEDLEEVENTKRISAENLKKVIIEIDEELAANADKMKEKTLKKAKKTLEKDYIPRTEKYEEYFNTLEKRNSFSKTDKDATFMRLKEDSVRNAQVKPAYNIQIGTSGQFILNYSIHQKPSDITCLIPHMNKFFSLYNNYPENIIADAGYGSEENYAFIEYTGMKSYVKYNTFFLESKKNFSKQIFKTQNWKYEEDNDVYICPNNKELQYLYSATKTTDNGYVTNIRAYECKDCDSCSMKELCTKGTNNKRITKNDKLNELKQIFRENAKTETGKKLLKQRSVDVESVFGKIKGNWGFRRFLLKGLPKVNVEWGLLSLAHNLTKLKNILILEQ